MSYVEHCKKHGQYHGEICGECFEDLKVENVKLRKALQEIAVGGCECCTEGSLHRDEMIDTARAALEGK
jgi:hypothetical protein